ncbi:MAG TPA: hypothetical protein VHO70_22460, partial [Chitinispirillaceae bacterium]|nr:hypothetical protein [Chitinispirillaceae bacterium]
LSLITGIFSGIFFFILAAVSGNHHLFSHFDSSLLKSIELTPWSGIGGCGAGGSGSGTADGIKWIGNGVSGGLIDVEILPKINIGQNFRYFTVVPQFSFKPTYTTTADIAIPIVSKTGVAQIQSNLPENNRTTGGLGDIYFDLSKTLGLTGQYQITLGLSMPTGQYDTKRVRDREPEFLPVDLQNGTGLCNASLALNRSFDVENGLWILDAAYNHPFVARPFSKKNEFLDTYFSDYKDRKGNRRFYYRGKPYGENDLGDYTPPSISLKTYFAYRGFEHYVHSFGLMFNAPFGVAWIRSPMTNTYNPAPDPDHQAWSGAFIYGVEFSRDKLPLFLAVSLPLHDKADSKGIWNAPDWDEFFQQWSFAFGFKTTFF